MAVSILYTLFARDLNSVRAIFSDLATTKYCAISIYFGVTKLVGTRRRNSRADLRIPIEMMSFTNILYCTAVSTVQDECDDDVSADVNLTPVQKIFELT
jgi:hypothetical protein